MIYMSGCWRLFLANARRDQRTCRSSPRHPGADYLTIPCVRFFSRPYHAALHLLTCIGTVQFGANAGAFWTLWPVGAVAITGSAKTIALSSLSVGNARGNCAAYAKTTPIKLSPRTDCISLLTEVFLRKRYISRTLQLGRESCWSVHVGNARGIGEGCLAMTMKCGSDT